MLYSLLCSRHLSSFRKTLKPARVHFTFNYSVIEYGSLHGIVVATESDHHVTSLVTCSLCQVHFCIPFSMFQFYQTMDRLLSNYFPFG